VRCTVCTSEFESAHEGGDRPARTAYAVALFYLCVECRAEWQASGEYARAARAVDPLPEAEPAADDEVSEPAEPAPDLITIGAVALEDFIRRRVAERRNGCAT
jgi:hypothetical protein